MVAVKRVVWLIPLLLLCLLFSDSAEAEQKPDFSNLREHYGVIWLPEDDMQLLYQADDRGWMGQGQVYSLWQYTGSMQTFLQEGQWKVDRPLEHEAFVTAMETLEPDIRFVPRRSRQLGYSYWQQTDIAGDEHDKLLLAFLPQTTMRDGVPCRRLLLVIESYG